MSQATATATQTVIRDKGGGLSAGATAGVAVGAVAIMFILVGGLWWFWMLAKKKKKGKERAAWDVGAQQGHAQEPYKHETTGNQIYEAP